MRKYLRILLLLMGFVVTMSGYGQVDAAPQELTEFAYNRAVAVTHARAALEEPRGREQPCADGARRR